MSTLAKKRWITGIALIPLLWILIGFILYPTLNTVSLSFFHNSRFSLEYYQQFFTYSKNMEAFRNTLMVGFATVIICGVIGTALAIFVNVFSFPGKKLMHLLLLSPIMLPGVVTTIVFMQLYSESGLVTKTVQLLFHMKEPPFELKGFWGIMFIHAYTQYIFFYVNVSAGLKRIDQSLIEAAKNMGASSWKVYRTIILPLMTPALVASSVLTFMTAVGSFAAPMLVGGSFRVMSVQILMTKVNNYLELAAVQGIMLSLISVGFLLVMRWFETRRDYTVSVKGRVTGTIRIESTLAKWVFVLVSCLLVFIIILPIFTLILLSFVKQGTWIAEIYPSVFSFDNYVQFFTEPRVMQPFINSINMAVLSTALAVAVGSISSYIIIKTKLKLKWLIEVLVLLPWALPASTVAINMVAGFNVPNIFSFNQVLAGSYWILPLTYFVGMLTLIVRSTNASLLQLHPSIEEASRSLGASWFSTFRKIVIPIVMPGILAGALLGFIGALGDYTSSALMYTVHNIPISVEMISKMYDFNIGLSMSYGVIQVGITILVILVSQKLGKIGDFKF
ncbi:iron ABC transporter permease [Metabacillus sp. GX 13764]|uniref:ABC transporter permease n=1 Tax=Metabacillus kandeliae TaxID=2900151 RepID=UPI001E57B0D1|nr:iron ABC transporter permease [Metabacillus kandeliae]MCD7033589.1 iron ABC transporter permease [Metabacillus kandeliae]